MNSRGTMLGVVAFAVLVFGCGGVKRQTRVIYPKGRVIQRSCDVVWPDLMRVFDKAGFRLRANDKRGGIASFVWINPQGPEIPGLSGDPNALVMAPQDGFWDQLTFWKRSVSVRVESAVFIMKPRPRACDIEVSVSYAGLESSGLLESRLLGEASAVTTRSKRNAVLRPEPEVASDELATTHQKSVPPLEPASAGSAVAATVDSNRTAVYRLPSP